MTTKLTVAAILFLLCAPAVADPAPPPSARRAPVAYTLAFTIADAGAKPRTHVMSVLDSCATLVDRLDERGDELRACAEPIDDHTTSLVVEWKADREPMVGTVRHHALFSTHTRVVLAKGATYQLGGTGDAQLALAVR